MSAPQQQSGAAAQAATAGPLDSILEESQKKSGAATPRSKDAIKDAVTYLIQQAGLDKNLASKDAYKLAKAYIAEIDKRLSAQVSEIMHQPEFQKLEGTWRGLHYLVDQTETSPYLKLKVLNVSKKDLLKDLQSAAEFTESALFKKVYTAEYDQAGGKPYGMLLGDYEFTHLPEDVELMQRISQVAAVSHAPFIAAASPATLNMESYSELSQPRDLAKIFEGVDYVKWRSFRDSDESRYVALTMPRVLARAPYHPTSKSSEGFIFYEDVDGKKHDKYLWMNSAWAYGALVTAAYSKDGWFARTRGVNSGGRVKNLPIHTFGTDSGGKAMKCPTEIPIPDSRENELSNLGFLPLLHWKDTDFAAFLGAQSTQKPKKYYGERGEAASSNAELSTKINFMLCVSRFAHYLKVLGRELIGTFKDKDKLENELSTWIAQYVHLNPKNATDDELARKPLAEARVTVEPVPGKPGWFQSVAHLRPHFQFEGMTLSMRLVAEMPKPKGG